MHIHIGGCDYSLLAMWISLVYPVNIVWGMFVVAALYMVCFSHQPQCVDGPWSITSFWQTRKGSRAQHDGCWSRLGQLIGVSQQLGCKKIPGSIIAQFHCEPWTDRGFIRVASIPSSLAPLHPVQASQWPKFSASARADRGETSPARIFVQNKLFAGPAVLGSAGFMGPCHPGLEVTWRFGKFANGKMNMSIHRWFSKHGHVHLLGEFVRI